MRRGERTPRRWSSAAPATSATSSCAGCSRTGTGSGSSTASSSTTGRRSRASSRSRASPSCAATCATRRRRARARRVTDVVLLAALVGDPICTQVPRARAQGEREGCKRRLRRRSTGRGIDRFVFTSTCCNYGLRESDEPATEDVGALARLALRRDQGRVRAVRPRRSGANGTYCPTLLRIATAYGLSQRMRFDLTISEFTRTLAIGDELVVYDADTWRPYCHVADISRAIMTVLEAAEDEVAGRGLQRRPLRRELHEADGRRGGPGAPRRRRARSSSARAASTRATTGSPSTRSAIGSASSREHRVPESVGQPDRARSRPAPFADVEQRPSFYTNHTLAIGAHAGDRPETTDARGDPRRRAGHAAAPVHDRAAEAAGAGRRAADPRARSSTSSLARASTRIDLCVGHLGELIRAYSHREAARSRRRRDLRYHWEDEPLGTAGALRLLEGARRAVPRHERRHPHRPRLRAALMRLHSGERTPL